jgi:tRNA G18 (ribose-2'-O)-methylase SpoU
MIAEAAAVADGAPVIATTATAAADSSGLAALAPFLGRGRTAVVVGSEGDGVSDEWREGLTRVAIPMLGRADSLNVAVSAAVLLFEARDNLG